MGWLDKLIEKVSFPGWVVHPYILLGGGVVVLMGTLGGLLWWLT